MRTTEDERIRIVGLAHAIFGEEKADRWLRKPQTRFEGTTPLQMLQTSDGLEQVEQLLIGLQEGYF